jgi:hypothetical protein
LAARFVICASASDRNPAKYASSASRCSLVSPVICFVQGQCGRSGRYFRCFAKGLLLLQGLYPETSSIPALGNWSCFSFDFSTFFGTYDTCFLNGGLGISSAQVDKDLMAAQIILSLKVGMPMEDMLLAVTQVSTIITSRAKKILVVRLGGQGERQGYNSERMNGFQSASMSSVETLSPFGSRPVRFFRTASGSIRVH